MNDGFALAESDFRFAVGFLSGAFDETYGTIKVDELTISSKDPVVMNEFGLPVIKKNYKELKLVKCNADNFKQLN
jgi:hypothetical protein